MEIMKKYQQKNEKIEEKVEKMTKKILGKGQKIEKYKKQTRKLMEKRPKKLRKNDKKLKEDGMAEFIRFPTFGSDRSSKSIQRLPILIAECFTFGKKFQPQGWGLVYIFFFFFFGCSKLLFLINLIFLRISSKSILAYFQYFRRLEKCDRKHGRF